MAVVGFDGDGGDLLHGEADADSQHWMLHHDGSDGPVEMAPAIADAATLPVEGGKRYEHSAGYYLLGLGHGLSDAKVAPREFIPRLPEVEAHHGLGDDRQAQALAASMERFEQRPHVNLAADRPEAAHWFEIPKFGNAEDPLRDGERGPRPPDRIERIAPAKGLLAQGCFLVGKGR